MKALRERLIADGVHSLLVQFTDVHGVAKGKLVPLAHLDDVLTLGTGFCGAAIAGTALPRTGPRADYMARGAASTACALPWLPGVARIVADGFVAGDPFEACPRQVLKRAVARLAEQHWSLHVGIEPEFFLLRQVEGRWHPADAAARVSDASHDVNSLLRQMPFLRELQEALEACGLDVMQLGQRAAQGQYEVKFAFADVLDTADQLMLFKLAAQAAAERHGMGLSMAAKPFVDQPGSGMHCHVSLWQGRKDNQRNLFVPHKADGSIDTGSALSPLGRQFIAGMLAHAPALTALAAPSIDSYARVAAGGVPCGAPWATTAIAQGRNNRTALVRTLHGRFEWRAPDASANPYLVLAGLIAAGLDGVERELDPGPDCDDDLFALAPAQIRERGIALLPPSLAEAVDALEADATICGALGDTLTGEFIKLKRAEHAAQPREGNTADPQRHLTSR